MKIDMHCHTKEGSIDLTMKFSNEVNRLHTKISKSSLVSALLDTEEDPEQTLKDIKELELMLEEYKKTL